MFDDLRVPTIAAVENMSAFECGHCHHLHYPFGPGYLNMLKEQFGMKVSDISLRKLSHLNYY